MRGEDGVVGLDDGGRHVRRGVHHELQLGIGRSSSGSSCEGRLRSFTGPGKAADDLEKSISYTAYLGLARELRVQPVHEERREAGASAAAERVKHDEALRMRTSLN